MRVQQIMTHPAVTVQAAESVLSAAHLMATHHVGVLPVCDAKQLIGVVTDRDVLVRAIAHDQAPGAIPVRSIMSSPPIVISPGAEVEEAAALLAQYRVRRLPVVEDGQVVGMVSADDVARCSTDDRFIAHLQRSLAAASHSALPAAR